MRCSRRCASTSLSIPRSSISRSRSSSRISTIAVDAFLRRHVVGGRVHREARHLAQHLARERIEPGQRLDVIVEQLDPHRLASGFGREDVDHVAAHAIGAGREVDLVARVLHVGEPAQQLALVHALATHQVQHHREVGLRVAEAVDRGDGGDDDRVAPLEQRLGRREPHLLDVLVHRCVLLDEGVGRRHVGLGLVIVVVADEVLDRVVREELVELAVELRGQRLVVRHHQRRPLQAVDHVRDRVGLARTRDAEQRLLREAVFEAFDQFRDRFGLVARGLVVRLQPKGSCFHGERGENRDWEERQITLKCTLPTAHGRLM